MKKALTLVFLFLISTQNTICTFTSLPFSLKKYDQSDILLEEEDKRELLRDIKTVYAPEYRIYTNSSIGIHMGKEKREICSYYQPNQFLKKCTGQNRRVTPIPLDDDNRFQIAKDNVLETFDIDDNLLDGPEGNGWLNFSNYGDATLSQKRLGLGLTETIPNVSSIDLGVFWHTEMDTQQIRKLQGK